MNTPVMKKPENRNIVLIKGTDLNDEQLAALKFNGMKKPDYVRRNAFFFEDGEPCGIDSGFYYPVTNPTKATLDEFPNS